MTKKLCLFQILVLIWGVFIHSMAYGEAMREIDNASMEVRRIIDSLKDGLQPADMVASAYAKSIARLEAAIIKGEEINSALEAQVEAYKAEKAELLKVQTTLASGLIVALVTAIVAIAGAILSAKNSKPDRDLKRLVVIEKARELRRAGANIPKDIERTYVGEIKSTG